MILIIISLIMGYIGISIGSFFDAGILKNNVPRYVLIEYSQLEKEEILDDEKVDIEHS